MRSSGTHTRLVAMLRDSIALLCKSSLLYEKELSVEGLLGITLDGSDIVLVNISQIFHPLDNNDDHVDGGHKRSSSREGSKAKVAQSHRSPSPVEKKNRVSPMERSRRSSPEDQSRKSPPQATTATSPAHDDTPAQSIKLDYDCIVIKDEKDIKTEVEDATDCFAALADSHAMDHDVAMSAMDAAQDICGLPTTNTSTLTQVLSVGTEGAGPGCRLQRLPKVRTRSGRMRRLEWDCDTCSDRKADKRRRSSWQCIQCRRGVCIMCLPAHALAVRKRHAFERMCEMAATWNDSGMGDGGGGQSSLVDDSLKDEPDDEHKGNG